jgi:Homing endonuclease associated repeat
VGDAAWDEVAGPGRRTYPASMDPKQELIERAKEVAARLGRTTLTRAEFSRETGVSPNQVFNHFDGMRDLWRQAGLDHHERNVRLDEDQIYSAMHDTFIGLGGITTRTRFDRASRYSVDVFKKRGMNWTAALAAFRQWCERNAPDFPYLQDLPASAQAGSGAIEVNEPNRTGRVALTWNSLAGKIYGEFLNFRGLQHAPVNEQGVVFLFGMVAHELGYVVESVQTGYPDCDAKRRVGRDRWERVRIEFEYSSRSFRDHGHDPDGCDLVVCWEHDWPDCPLEVLELRSAIRQLAT